MEDFDDRQQAGEYLRMTLKLIAQYSLITNLANITLFYTYAEGKHTLLNQTINDILKKNGTIVVEDTKNLFKRFFDSSSTNPDSTNKVLSGLNKIVGELGILFSGSVDAMSDKGKVVEDYSLQISQLENYNDVEKIIENMLFATRDLVSINKKTQSQIQSSADNIDVLKSQLKKVRQEAQTDILTLLPNRRFFTKKLLEEKLNVMNNNAPVFSIMLIDVDRFKQINDTYGHFVGDSALKGIARVFKKNIRQNDFAARIGGDEFSIILPQTALLQAIAVAIKIKSKVGSLSWKIKKSGENFSGMTLSIGIALYHPHESEEDFITRADKALYLAKESGRNTIKTEQDL